MLPHLAAIRFGTGLSPDIAPPGGAADMLDALAGPDRAAQAHPMRGWADRMVDIRTYVDTRKAGRADDAAEAAKEAFRVANRTLSEAYHADLAITLARAATTRDGFRERLAWFWADHFAVSDGAGRLRRTVPAYHEAAIRPHLAGNFADLLVAAATHPAMVDYLDQSRSVGPNSPRGEKGAGLNENLAREVLELHTLGAGAPYDQTDVTQLAELLTGLAVTREGELRFDARRAEPGAETVLDRTYGGPRPDAGDIDRVLRDLAVHPATARHVSGKLATHFVSDTPPADMVDAMAAAWAATDGDLMAVYAAMLDHPAAADPVLHKVRRPLDLVAAAARATGTDLTGEGVRVIRGVATAPLMRMGQPWQRPPGPQGFPEDSAAWITPQALAARLQWALDLGRRLDLDPRAFVDTALGPLATPRTRFAADAAEDRAAGLALVLASPEFQRR